MAKYLDEIALAVAVVATGGAALAAFAPAAFGGLGASIGAATGIGAGAGTAGATAATAGGTVGGLSAGGVATGATLGEVAAAGGAEIVAGGQAASTVGTTTAVTAAEGATVAEAAGGGGAGLFGTGISGSQAIQGAGAVAAVGGAYQQNVANKDIVRAQQRQNMFAGRLRDLQTRREVLSQINSGRVAQAQVANNAAQTGGTGSSGAAGSISSVGSQVGSNISFLDQGRQIQSDIFGQAQRAQTSSERAGMAGSVSKLGFTFGQGVFNDLFS